MDGEKGVAMDGEKGGWVEACPHPPPKVV